MPQTQPQTGLQTMPQTAARRMPGLLIALLLAGVTGAQTPVRERPVSEEPAPERPAPERKDPLGRDTPQNSVFQFLEACHARDYSKALYYLDLRRMLPAERAKTGPDLARQLEDLLDD